MASNKCEDCGKMASLELEVQSVDAEVDDGQVTVMAELELVTACCSASVGAASVEETVDVEVEHVSTGDPCPAESYSVSVDFEEGTDWFVGKGRGAVHWWGVEVSLTVTCDTCGAESKIDCRVGEQGSAF